MKKIVCVSYIIAIYFYTSVTAAGTTYMTFMPNRFVNTVINVYIKIEYIEYIQGNINHKTKAKTPETHTDIKLVLDTR